MDALNPRYSQDSGDRLRDLADSAGVWCLPGRFCEGRGSSEVYRKFLTRCIIDDNVGAVPLATLVHMYENNSLNYEDAQRIAVCYEEFQRIVTNLNDLRRGYIGIPRKPNSWELLGFPRNY